jgi:hypothetical protein
MLGRTSLMTPSKRSPPELLREYGRRHPDIDVGDFHPGIMAIDFGRYLGTTGMLLKVLPRHSSTAPTTARAG